MDRLHHDLFIALDALCGSDDVAFCTKFTAFVTQIEQAFRKEESWMDDVDLLTNAAHQEQHARTLAALHHIHALVMDGNLDIGRHVVKDLLPQWLSFHFSTMDATFALALQLTEMGREPSPLMI
ncbi:hypothetical protein AYR66_05830 [Noviherbaspirillum denitrificans]|uniref:Hemerythrin-like domain-containing protein n=2 Tax=Noviherbaspirillum denitrificans TaxID=1968433 RepID=A0A254T8U8_9BURK|nr:hypothetical protein AYR66_05830 [Noviherbaspirillum denitrificans]